MVVNKAVLCCGPVNKAGGAKVVYEPRRARRERENLVYGRLREDLLANARVLQLPFYETPGFSPVEGRQPVADVNPLPDGGVRLQLKAPAQLALPISQ
ncbi:MAG: hypothetical protein LBL83_04410 [Clostridiales bacterium]|nr:hypothetical protein [Clostridiales bacterium]